MRYNMLIVAINVLKNNEYTLQANWRLKIRLAFREADHAYSTIIFSIFTEPGVSH
jgi:hypothetical protein